MDRVALKQWLSRALADTGETPSALARRAGLATTTLTRFLSDDTSPMLSMRTVAKIEHVIKTPLTDGFSEAEGAPYTVAKQSRIAHAIAALTAGHASASPWLLQSRALEAAGYMQGDVLIVDLNERPIDGGVACAQHYDWQTRSAETVFRVFEAPYLVAAPLDPALAAKLRKPLLVDNDRVIIKGAVIASLRGSAHCK